MNRKGIFPYEYISSLEKLNDKQLPDIKSFYSTLHDAGVSDKDYDHAKQVWEKFNIYNTW